ncbi:MAG: pyrrolo-quinoline quinone [Phycisphaerales bacterium]|nr:pyrrolo-quinoline quinone [Phycisphaerales bacterium]
MTRITRRSLAAAPALAALAFLAPALLAPAARADDWPQWLGPNRDGIWREAGLADAIPPAGLPVRWRAPVGAGYAGPAVAGGKVFVLDRELAAGAAKPADPFQQIAAGIPGAERVTCLDAATGKQLWQFAYDCPYTVSYAAGPRCTPAVDGDRVYTYGTEGHLYCLDVASGKVVWGRKLFAGPTPMWGYAGHPLVDGDLVYVPVADPKGVLYALDKKTGELKWQAIPAKEAGYSPPIVREVSGRRQLIQWVPAGVTSLDPVSGKVLWTVSQEPMKYGVTAVTPVVHHDAKLGDVLFVASQYGGSLLLGLDKDAAGNPTAKVLWRRVGKSDRTSDAIQTLMATPVLRAGHVFGLDARGQLRCLVLATGDRVWESQAVTTYDEPPINWASTFMTPLGTDPAGGPAGKAGADAKGGPAARTLFANEHGDVLLGNLTPAGLTVTSKAHLIDPTNTDAQRPALWSHPAYANKCVYWKNDKELVCWSFAKE